MDFVGVFFLTYLFSFYLCFYVWQSYHYAHKRPCYPLGQRDISLPEYALILKMSRACAVFLSRANVVMV